MNKLKLPNVTLCTFGSEKYRDQHQKSLDYSSRFIEFGAVKNIIVQTNNINEWNKAVVFDLGDYIETDFALLIHADGGIGEPQLWRDEWLQYDYIGSPFPLPRDNFSFRDIHGKIQRVGNSVSLRSKKLLQLPKKIGMEWKPFHGFYNEDGYICVGMRHVFEEHGCKFAPFEEAIHFGREMPLPENKGLKTFVYHRTIGENACYPNFEEKETLVTEIYKGQGLGNQLWCYATTRVIAEDKGYDFGIMHPEKFKCLDFLNLDFSEKVIGGKGPEGGPPTKLPDGIKYYYKERIIIHPENGADITTYDKNLVNVLGNTKIDGNMQDEKYIAHKKDQIRDWFKVKEEYSCYDYSNENTCIINFRGGEYVGKEELFLTEKYWADAVENMRKINPNMKFVVVTDDTRTAKTFFPDFEITHKSIANDYSIINNAYYLILSNSSFAWFPTWLNEKVKFVIAPKYWARHNVSDGYWACDYNITSGWMYQDREGNLNTYEECLKELDEYKKNHKDYYDVENKNGLKYMQKPSFYNSRFFIYIKRKIGKLFSHNTKRRIKQLLKIRK